MAIPTIETATSIPDPIVGEPYSFIPAAVSATPITWSCSTLPAGLSINTATGEISGTPTSKGFATVFLTATNTNGPATVTVYLAVYPSPYTNIEHLNPAENGTNLVMEINTREVTSPYSSASAGPPTFIATFIGGEDVLLYVQFTKNGIFRDLGAIPSGDIELAFKQFEPEGVLIVADTHITQASGQDKTYILPCSLDPSQLAPAMSDNETDAGTGFVATAQLRVKVPNSAGIGADPLTLRSKPFGVLIIRNFTP